MGPDYLATQGLLFVYGTLQKSGEAAALLNGASFLGAASTVPRYHLVNVPELGEDAYGLELGGAESIPGELYQVTPEHLAELDTWEEDYQRANVMLSDGRVADSYFIR